jgi:hypothetical protein
MAADKSDEGKKRFAIYVGIGISILLLGILAYIEIYIQSHKPKLSVKIN